MAKRVVFMMDIYTGNGAIVDQSPGGLCVLLRDTIRRLEAGQTGHYKIFDANGNSIGSWSYETEPEN